ncbi:ABC-type multidrug transport system ATPase subunit [Thermosporothrix hazakensis]|jgi:ABC-type multidrug transport system ATPase subunit/pSer/pThr/pTyr-binding forkhead associated (FHA) protein/ABC-type multidrug transport system permease subunit|uniref:ABC-type multidrug transport system ATPase subunit n=2 Tax=Thermosporothrix TaxID=768650 RepID=A0A326TT33_THEHA|nr:FHA domain-containing protein [Thermosporothrix hazakensis]PZW19733.1 ABC-type multidrug transport system ATPase subunit [Thermosporothrix hazakensis]BBH90548.1 hypothetical protein KTC_52990 [Thermosporothrix sp. COM3]GCE48601.1 hypothetical protein KTH_34700 [Thermosporothrix hazakensis]
MNAASSPPGPISVQFLTGPLKGKSFPLNKPLITLGREGSNDVVIPDPKVSRHHARITWNNGSWMLENLSQHSIVTVNQNKIQQAAISHNTIVGLGEDTTFVFLAQAVSPPNQPSSPQQMVLSAHQPAAAFAPTPPPVAAMPNGPASPVPPPSRGLAPDKTAIEGMPSLEVSSNIQREKQSHRLLKPVINIGRNPQCDIIINEPVVSGFHAQIVRENNQWVLVHPHPSRGQTLNGLMYQGRIIHGNEQFRKPLVHGDIFRIGDEHGTLVTLTYDDGSGTSQEIPPEIHPIPLGAPSITLGRAPNNMVVLNHPQVSAHHARLDQQPNGGYRLLDLNSTNHTYINGRQVTNHLLAAGDEIRIGPYRLTYTGTQLTQYDESNSIRIDALNLYKEGNNKVILLNDISLVIPPRKFVALVGGSGAGKSTLMDALNGLRPAHKGVVLYNGQDYYQNLAAFSTQLGYVPQDDIVHRELTVERALYYAAKMRLPSDFTREQIEQRINEVLEDVEMTQRRKLLVNRLSGGQRKRVSIALELLANPSIFFLDEPTSGLDPGLDRKMMYLLRRLADRGRTIILVTHATNNINACDYVCFLAQGGRVAYFGPPNEAKAFFGKSDFAEIYSALEPTPENPRIPEEAEARFKNSPDYYQYVVTPLNEGQAKRANGQYQQQQIKRVKRGNPFAQFWLLAMRYVELLKNDPGNLALLLLQAPIIALLLVFMVRFEIGTGIFNTDKIVMCRTQTLVEVTDKQTNHTQKAPLMMPEAKEKDTVTCDKAQDFLQKYKDAKEGPEAARDQNFIPAKELLKQNDNDVKKALQEFLMPGYGQDAQTVLFIMAFGTVLFGCINGSREIVKEAHIYRRERAVNLGILPYMFSKIIVLSILCLFQAAVLLAIIHIGEPLQKGVFLPVLLEVYITLVLCSIAGLMIGLTISAIAPNNDRAISFVPIILIPQVIFAGAIIPFKDWFLQIPAFIFPTRWAMAALGSSVGLHSDKINGDKLFGDTYTYQGQLFSTYSQNESVQRILLAWGALIAIIVVLTILIGLFLKRKDARV